jgi:RNA polymerase sigma-70 factor (ECF subfamily)
VASAEAARVGADEVLVDRLRSGDEETFVDLVRRWSPGMLRLARHHVASDASAEDVVQEAWLGVLEGLDRFEGRSSLRTYVFTILVNRAKTRGVREHRTMPLPLTMPGAPSADDATGPVVDPDRFQGPDGDYPGHWTSAGQPQAWQQPEHRAMARETMSLVERALDGLPERQRIVVTLRDVHGLSSDEVCGLLELSAVNQRMLLHRGRSALRNALEGYYRA